MGQLVPRQIPTLFGGVSRQPTIVRNPNQVEEGENALFSVVTGGFEKRPNTQHIAALTNLDISQEYAVHAIDRDNTEQLFVLLAPDGDDPIFVFDAITGAQKTVNIGDSTRYFLVEAIQVDSTGLMDTSSLSDAQGFAWDSSDRYQIYHDDTTFDWVYTASDGALDWDLEGSEDGTSWVDLATGNTGTSGSFSTTVDAVATGDHNYIRISIDVAAGTAADTFTLKATYKDKTYLVQGITGPEDYAFTTVADFTFIANRTVKTRLAEADSGSVTDTARSTSSGTPPAGIPAPSGGGNIYKIIDDGNKFATYHVQDDATENLYIEVADPLAHNEFDYSSMPHQLVRETDGTFTFNEATWDPRAAGDEVVTKAPNFVGSQVNDLAFFRERLVFLAGESVYLSQSGEPLNMWPEKAIEVLDTDPIQRSARTNSVNIMRYAAVFRKLLFATSEKAQFELSALESMTPSTAAFDLATSYPASPIASPEAMGDVLFFASSGADHTTIYEYFFSEATFGNTAGDITKHVVDYLPNDVIQMVTDTQSGTMYMLTSGAQNKVFIYRTFFDGAEKIQSSWSEYTFGATEAKAFIHGMEVFSGFLVLIIERFDGVIYMEQMPIERETPDADMGYIPIIDQREIVTGTYVTAADCTYWDTTWQHEDDSEVVLGQNFTGDDIGRRMVVFYPDQYDLTLSSVVVAETIVIDDGTTSQTYTARIGTTTANREFGVSGNDAADAGELVTVINDPTDGHPTITATDLGAGVVRLNVDDPCDGTIIAPTGTAITNATIVAATKAFRTAARGEHDDDEAYVGRAYTMTVELSKLFMRDTGDSPAVLDGRLQVRDITFRYEKSGYFTVTVTPKARDAKMFEFTGRIVGDVNNIIGKAAIIDRGSFTARVNSNGETAKIEVENDTPFPSVITAAAWRAFFNEVARQG